MSFSWNFAPFFGNMRHISSILFLAETLYTFSKSNLSKYKFVKISPEQSKVWSFALYWAPFLKIIKSFSYKSTEDLSPMTLKSDAKFKENWLVVSNMTWGIWWVFTHPLKSPKRSLQWAILVQSVWGLSLKNTEKLSFMALNSDAKCE